MLAQEKKVARRCDSVRMRKTLRKREKHESQVIL